MSANKLFPYIPSAKINEVTASQFIFKVLKLYFLKPMWDHWLHLVIQFKKKKTHTAFQFFCCLLQLKLAWQCVLTPAHHPYVI